MAISDLEKHKNFLARALAPTLSKNPMEPPKACMFCLPISGHVIIIKRAVSFKFPLINGVICRYNLQR